MADTITSPTTTPEAVLAAAKKMLADGPRRGHVRQHLRPPRRTGSCASRRRRSPYDTMTLDDLVVVDLDGNVRARATRSPTTEKDLHLVGAARATPSSGAVIHTHAVYATMFALAHEPIPAVIEEVVVYVGGDVPCCDYKGTGSVELGDEVATPPRRPGRRPARQPRPGHLRVDAGEGAAQRRPRRAHRQDRVGRPGDGRHDPPAARRR